MSLIDQAVSQVTARFTALEGRVSERQMAVVEVSLETFLKLPSAAVPLVFYVTVALEETDFQYELPDPRSPLDRAKGVPHEAVTVNLEETSLSLQRFRSHLGKPYGVWFNAPYSGVLISCMVFDDWYQTFSDELLLAEERARAQAEGMRAAELKDQAAALERHAQRLRLLLDDTGFLRLARVKSTAQRTLINYARQREPEAVAALGEVRLKEVIAELREWVLMHAVGGPGK